MSISQNKIREICERNAFSFAEIEVLSRFVNEELLENTLHLIAFSGLSIGEYLYKVLGMDSNYVYKIFHEN